MRNPNKKLTEEELEAAVSILYAHYGLDFVDNAEDLANEVSEQFDCNVTQDQAYKYFRRRTIEETDSFLTFQNTQ